MRAWKPVPVVEKVIKIFFIIGILCIIFGIILLIYSYKIVEVSVQYNNHKNACAPMPCSFNIQVNVPEDV